MTIRTIGEGGQKTRSKGAILTSFNPYDKKSKFESQRKREALGRGRTYINNEVHRAKRSLTEVKQYETTLKVSREEMGPLN